MNDSASDLAQGGDDVLVAEISDEALEAAAGAPPGAFSISGAPTVSIVVMCCGDNGVPAP